VKMKYKVAIGDLLYAPENNTFGFICKITPKFVYYHALGSVDFNNVPFKVLKRYLYEKIDDGSCMHQIGKTKYRRIR